jgi:hypothetical protein
MPRVAAEAKNNMKLRMTGQQGRGLMRRSWPALVVLACAIAPALVRPARAGDYVHTGGAHTGGTDGTPLRMSIAKDYSIIHARGRWVEKLKRGAGAPILPTNAVEIQCNRKGMSCEEVRAEAGKPRDDVSLTRRTFTVTEWTPQRILARSDTDSADLMLRIFPDKQSVELSYWDTKPQRERTGPADGWVWVLH